MNKEQGYAEYLLYFQDKYTNTLIIHMTFDMGQRIWQKRKSR